MSEICVKLTIPTLSLGFRAALSWSLMFGKIISRSLQDKGIYAELPQGPIAEALSLSKEPKPWLVMGMGNRAIGIFGVTDRMAGLRLIRAALEELGLLRFSQIAWFDTREAVWMAWYPEGSMERFESTAAMTLDWLKNTVCQLDSADLDPDDRTKLNATKEWIASLQTQ